MLCHHFRHSVELVIVMVIGTTTLTGAPALSAEREPINPPSQPASGPGGATCNHHSVLEHSYGNGDLEYWLMEPAEPKPESAPVVIFNHGWSAMSPYYYRAWINHIVRRGNIVIYPRYQASLHTPPADMSSNAIAATKEALEELQTGDDHVKPQLDKVCVVGHSAGGNISAGIAARAAASNLPTMKAVMCVEPGKAWGPVRMQIPLDDVSAMPASTLLLTIVGDRDTVVKDIDAKRIINETVLVPFDNKNFVTINSDEHGDPPLIANHFFPAAPDGKRAANNPKPGRSIAHGADTLDYFGTWKLFDALQDTAITGQNREKALGDTAEQKSMGTWSDGVPVKPLKVQVGAVK